MPRSILNEGLAYRCGERRKPHRSRKELAGDGDRSNNVVPGFREPLGFFTVNLRGSSGWVCCELRFVVFGRDTPSTEAVVTLPHHLHGVWTLAPGDTDFSTAGT